MAMTVALGHAQTAQPTSPSAPAEPRLKTRSAEPEPVPISGPDGRLDPRLTAAGTHLADSADRFSITAQQYMCRETLRQRAIRTRSVRRVKGAMVVKGSAPQYDQRQIVSFYAFTTVGRSPVIHEIRRVLKVDKETLAKEEEGRNGLRNALLQHDDEAKGNLLGSFDVEALRGVATEMGQMLLLFSRSSINDYTFEFDREDTLGGARTVVLQYNQRRGKEGVRITEGSKHLKNDLHGWLWLKLPDYIPVRITMISTHTEKKREVREEAEVDYGEYASGALLPAAVIHRRFEDDILAAEDDFRYSECQSLK